MQKEFLFIEDWRKGKDRIKSSRIVVIVFFVIIAFTTLASSILYNQVNILFCALTIVYMLAIIWEENNLKSELYDYYFFMDNERIKFYCAGEEKLLRVEDLKSYSQLILLSVCQYVILNFEDKFYVLPIKKMKNFEKLLKDLGIKKEYEHKDANKIVLCVKTKALDKYKRRILGSKSENQNN